MIRSSLVVPEAGAFRSEDGAVLQGVFPTWGEASLPHGSLILLEYALVGAGCVELLLGELIRAYRRGDGMANPCFVADGYRMISSSADTRRMDADMGLIFLARIPRHVIEFDLHLTWCS